MSKAEAASVNPKRRTLPFKTPPKALEPFIIDGGPLGTLELPRYNGLLAGEMLEFTAAAQASKRREVMKRLQNATPEEIQEIVQTEVNGINVGSAMMEFSEESATIIIKYRIDDGWTAEDTKRLPQSTVQQLATALQQEMTAGTAKKEDKQAPSDEEPLDPTKTQEV